MKTNDLDIIIGGGGRVGAATVERLSDHGHEITIIERRGRRCDELLDRLSCSVIEGDITNPEVLSQADPAGADVFAALTGSTGTNLAACVLVLRINEEIRTITRTNRSGLEEAYREIVDEVVSPDKLGGVAAANAIIGGGVRAIEELTENLRIMDMTVAEDAPVAGKKLSDVRFPDDCLVVSSREEDRIATGETKLDPGHTFIVAIERASLEEVRNLFRG